MSDEQVMLPVASASVRWPETAEILALSARARGQLNTPPAEVTERVRLVVAHWAGRLANEPDSKAAAHLAWDRITAVVTLVSPHLDADYLDAVWSTLRAAADRVRAEMAPRIAGLLRETPRQMDTEKAAQRAANRAAFWAVEYAERASTPKAAAGLAVDHLMSDLVKVRRAELDDTELWRHVRRELDGLLAVLLPLLGLPTEGVGS